MSRSLSVRGVVGFAVLLFTACPAPSPAPRPVDTSSVKQVVGPAGGTLTHPTGAKLTVPAGALSAEVELSLTGVAAPSSGAPAVGQGFLLGPEGQQFVVPLEIEVPVDVALVQKLEVGADELRLRLAPQSTMQFVELATTADTARQVLAAKLTHFSIIVPVASGNGFTFSSDALPAASVGVPYAGAIVVSGGTGPYSFSVVAGTLPPGVTLDAMGLFSGTPTQGGSFTFTVRVTDSASNAAEAVLVMSVGGVGQCNSVPNSGPLNAELRVAAAAPSPQGGPLFAGTWERATTTVYTGPGGATGPSGRELRQTLRLTQVGASLRFDSVYQEPGGSIDLVSGSATSSGAELTITFNCPQSGTRVFGYSATADALVLYEAVSSGTREMIFLPQGTQPPDAGVGADAGTGPDGGSSCGAPFAAGALVAEQFVGTQSGQAMGGALSDGVYELISDGVYDSDAGVSGPTGLSRKHSLNFSGATVSSSEEDAAGARTATYSLVVAGPTVVLTPSCPAGGAALNLAYSVLPGEQLQLMRGSPRGTLISVYQRVSGPGADAGTPVDAGFEVLGTGFTDLVDLAYDPGQAFLYTLGGGEVRRCDTAACGGSGTGTLISSLYASSLAVDNGTLFVTTDFQNVKTCDVSACSLSTFAALGANTYPAHLVVANGRVYWLAEAGSGRRIQACPLTGCGAGPTAVYSGAELDGVPVSGVSVDAAAIYVSSFTGGLWRIPLSSPDAAGGPAVSLTGSAYGTGGLLVDGQTLTWTESLDNRVRTCTLPACADTSTARGALISPSSVAVDSTYVYGADRGTPNGSGGYVAGTGRVWRYRK